MWIENIKKGDKSVSQSHGLILQPIENMMKSITLWKKAMDLNPTRFPSGCFTTLTVEQLREFWENGKT